MVQAAFRLAQCFRYGLGVDRLPEMAFEWTQRAASRGHAESQHELGDASPHLHLHHYDGLRRVRATMLTHDS